VARTRPPPSGAWDRVILVIAGLLGLVAAKLTQNYLVTSLVSQKTDRQAANNAWNILTDLMRSSFRLMIFVGILFLIAAWLAGPGRDAPLRAPRARTGNPQSCVGLRRARARRAVLLLNSQVSDFSRFLFVVILLALGAAWIELTRRQTMLEFPDAGGSTMISDARGRVSEWLEDRRSGGTSSGQDVDVTAQLANLADLHTQGKLSDEEYASAKARVLAGE
jgi:hypothetical protein